MTVEASRLTFAYGRLRALDDVSASARPGAVTALIGPNAAGKSTLLKCIIGSLRPGSGRVLVDGAPAHRLRARRLARRVAYVPQRSTIGAAFTVRDVVELGRYALPPDHGRVAWALERLCLGEIVDRAYTALSVGQQQRVTLARALAQVAEDGHLVLDEPMSAMDLAYVRDCAVLLRELAAGGATILVALHDLILAASLADDAWLLEGGRLVAAGPAPEVLDRTRLEAVFGVRFQTLRDESGRPCLWPHLAPPNPGSDGV